MRLERKSLLACTLFLLTGCSAARHSHPAASESVTPDRVPLPIRHSAEYDSGGDNYDYDPGYESAPSRGEQSFTPRSSLPPAAPMREPSPAPPAIGVSRVKSVSWRRRSERISAKNPCGDTSCVDECMTGNTSPLAKGYLAEGCDTPPQLTVAPLSESREKTNLAEIIRGWRQKRRTLAQKQVRTPRNCGEQTVAAPGCCAETFQTFPPDDATRKSDGYLYPKNSGSRSGSLAEPLTEDGWEDNATHRDNPGFTPDELMELPSNLQQRSETQPQSVPHVWHVTEESDNEHAAGLPVPLDASVPASAEQPNHLNSVRTNIKPPMWPRLGAPEPKPVNLPAAAPTKTEDSTMPLIQPDRRI